MAVGPLKKRVEQRILSTLVSFRRFTSAKRGAIFIEQNHEFKNTILLIGSGRGGTTWLAELINADNTFRYVFEPFHPHRVKEFAQFRNRQYLRPENDDPRYLHPTALALSGRIRNDWCDQYNRRLFCSRRLVKDIRLGLLVGWIQAHFPQIPIVTIIRHPCAVAASRLFNKRPTQFELEDILSQNQLIEDWLTPFIPTIRTARTDFERQVAIWCIETLLPLRTLSKNSLVIFYEHLCIEPRTEIDRLCSYLQLNSSKRMLQQLSKPSSQIRKGASAIDLGQDPVTLWRQHIDQQAVQRAFEILDAFGLTYLYASDGMPRLSGQDVLAKVPSTPLVQSGLSD